MTGSSTATIGGNSPTPPPGWARWSDRIMARLRARSIDDELLNGDVTDGRAVVMVRRARLLHRRYRASVAGALRALVAAARRRDRAILRPQLPLREDEIRQAEPLILTLADEVEVEDGLSPRGVILADRLIRDGDSPVYVPTPGQEAPQLDIESAVKHARAALHLG